VHCLGNHEFDYGWERILAYVDRADFDLVSANLRHSDGHGMVPPFVVQDVGPVRVAVVGAILEDLLGMLGSDSLGPWRAAPLTETLTPVVASAAAQADVVLVLGHLGAGEAEEILEALPDVAAVIQGHPHRAWDARVAELVDVPIGEATHEIARDELRYLRERVMRESTGADLAHMNRGGVRDVLPAGEILARNVWNVMPFDNLVLTTELRGSDIIPLHEIQLRGEPMDGFDAIDPE